MMSGSGKSGCVHDVKIAQRWYTTIRSNGPVRGVRRVFKKSQQHGARYDFVARLPPLGEDAEKVSFSSAWLLQWKPRRRRSTICAKSWWSGPDVLTSIASVPSVAAIVTPSRLTAFTLSSAWTTRSRDRHHLPARSKLPSAMPSAVQTESKDHGCATHLPSTAGAAAWAPRLRPASTINRHLRQHDQ